jgi:pilus assembly protein Flp/PilA
MLYLPRENGQGLVEYGMILVLIAVIVALVLLLVGPAVGNLFSSVVDGI